MSLQPFRPVDRRASWRARIPLWDRETFQAVPVGRVGQAQNATIALAVFSRHADCCPRPGWRDYGWARPWPVRPILAVSTDDGTGFLALASADPASSDAPAEAAILNVPPDQVGAIRPGVYRVSTVAAYADGTVLDLGSDLVTFHGEAMPTGFNRPMMAGGPQPAGIDLPVNGIFVPIPALLPAPYRAPGA